MAGGRLKLDPEDEHWRERVSITEWRGRLQARTTTLPQRPLHRVLMNAPKGLDVDHINGDQLDNRKCNLRIVTRAQNLHNRELGPRHNSPYQGVYPLPYGWCARMGNKYLGSAPTAEAANLLRLSAEMKEWGIEPRRRQAFIDAGIIKEAV